MGHSQRVQSVESLEQLAFLKSQGCDECQGYFINEPLQVEQVTRLLARRAPLYSQFADPLGIAMLR